MATGWLNIGGKWYYLSTSGAMKTGWIASGGKSYYLDNSGVMLANTTIDGNYLGPDGALVDAKYIGNSNTGKFHYPSCHHAEKIAILNRVGLESREEAIKQGFVPCQVCKP